MALVIFIKAVPRSGRTAWTLDKSGTLKCSLKSAPERGNANKELIRFLADSLSIPQDKIDLLSGHTSRIKKIKIDKDITFQQLLSLLGLPIGDQHALF